MILPRAKTGALSLNNVSMRRHSGFPSCHEDIVMGNSMAGQRLAGPNESMAEMAK